MSWKNIIIHLVAAASFFIGISMCSFSVIVPAYVKTYTDNAWVLGAIPVIYSVGMSVPQIFSIYFFRKHYYKGREKRNPVKEYFILEFLHRSTFIIIGISILLLGKHPLAALVMFFIFFALCNIVCGLSTPVWVDMLSVTIPDNVRTMFMSFRELVGRSFGILASLSVAVILSAAVFPANYGLLFLIAGVLFTAGIVPILWFDQVQVIKGESQGLEGGLFLFIKKGFLVVAGNKRLMGVLLLYWGLGISRISYAYYTPYIIDNVIRQYPAYSHNTMISHLNMSLLIFIAGNSLLVGRLITKIGHRFALILGAAGLIISNIVILVSHTFVAAIIGQYFLSIFMLSMYLASLNAQMDFAPHEDRSTITAIVNTVNAIFIAILSFAGSMIASTWGYGVSLGVAAGGAGVIMLIAIARSPYLEKSSGNEVS